MATSPLPAGEGAMARSRSTTLIQRVRAYLPEIVVTLLLAGTFVLGSLLSPYFLDSTFLFKQMILYIEIGVIALGLTYVIITGNLDLSVASNMAMVACVSAYLHAKMGVPFEVCIFLGLLLGTLGGAVNGYLVAWLGLPSLTVTLATLALYRGVAQVLVGDYSIQDMPDWFFGIDRYAIAGTNIPLELILWLVLAAIMALVLHRTVVGRWIYMIGTNEKAAFFSGVPVRRIKLLVFTLSGFLAGLAALMLNSRLMVARYDHARGWELDAITAVVLGGTSIAGGRGTIYGTVVALFLIGILRTAMGVANVKVEAQLTAVGILLIVAVIVSDVLARRRRK